MLKWTGIGELNSDEHYIYYCGQELHRRNGAALTINKNSKCSTWVQPQKWQNYLSSFLRQTIQHHSHPSLCPNHGCWRNWSWLVLWKPTRLPRTNTKKKKNVLFIIGDWNVMVGSQEIPGVTGNFGYGVQNEAGQSLTEFCQEKVLVIENTLFSTAQETTLPIDITKRSILKSDWLHSLLPKMEKMYTVIKNKTWSWQDWQDWRWLRSSAPHSKIQA